MKHLFVPYEIALRLKEKGFDEPCFGYYQPMKEWMIEGTRFNGEKHFHGPNWSNSDDSFYFMYIQNSSGDRDSVVKNSSFTKAIENIAVPLYQQVIDWFREKQIDITVITEWKNGKRFYRVGMSFVNLDNKVDIWFSKEKDDIILKNYISYYEALNKAIEEALKLI